MEIDDGRRFGGIARQTKRVDVALHIGVVRDVDVFEGWFFRQFGKVP